MVEADVEREQRDDDNDRATDDRRCDADSRGPVGADRVSLIVQPPRQHTLADRGLDVAEAGLGNADRDSDPNHELRVAGRVIDVPDDENRPVPQVDAVRASADLDEWLPPEDRADPFRGRVDDDGDDDHRQDRNHGQQPLIDVAGLQRGSSHDADQQRQRTGADRVEPTSSLVRRRGRSPRPPDEGRSRTEQQSACASEGVQIEPVVRDVTV